MNEKEISERLEKEIQNTVEFDKFVKEGQELTGFLSEYIPESKFGEMALRLERYSERAADVAQKGMQIAEELAESEDL